MDAAPPIKPEYGPSLPELLRRWLPRRARIALAVVAGVAAVALVASWLLSSDGDRYVHRSEPVFNLRWREHGNLQPVQPTPGVILQLEARRRGELVQSFSVRPLSLPPSERALETDLLLVSDELVRRELAPRFEGFAVADEGKARVNDAIGYQLAFRAERDGKPIVGRQVLLLDPEGSGREGVILTMTQRPRGPVDGPADVGAEGPLRIPYRSFRWGTDWPT